MGDSSQQVRVWRCGECGAVLAFWTRPREKELRKLFPDGCWLFVRDAIRLAQPYTNTARVECKCGQVNVFSPSPHTLRERLETLAP